MMSVANLLLNLTVEERVLMRKNKIKKIDLIKYTPNKISSLLNVSHQRAMELIALVDFQQIPSIGIKFAED